VRLGVGSQGRLRPPLLRALAPRLRTPLVVALVLLSQAAMRSSTRAASTETEACFAHLREGQVEAQVVAAPPAPLADCAIAAPVQLASLRLANGEIVKLPDHPILDCAFAATFTEFVHDLVGPLGAAILGSPVVALATGPGYECRSRDRVVGAKPSAHGKGIAIDLSEIVLADRRRIVIAHPASAVEEVFVRTIRRGACGWFTTVLGPGSDAAHADHLHFDSLSHGANDNYRICE